MQPEPYPVINDDETISRVITRSGDYARTIGRVKASLFKTSSSEFSVMRIDGLLEQEIRELEITHVTSGKPAKGRAEITKARIIEINNLNVVPDTVESYSRHANIIGMSIDSQQREMEAIKLAENSTLKVYS